MGYSLGVDLGNTYVAAAVQRASEVEMCPLGESSLVMPAVVYIGDEGVAGVGDPALRRGRARPDRLVRGLRRRLGDAAPVVVDGRPLPVTDLLARLLRTVLDTVTEQQGAAPERVVLARPAAWDAARCSLYDEVARLAGLDAARTVTESEAVVRHYAASRPLADGRVLAVYDLGGGTFDVSLVRKVPAGTEILGEPLHIERLGGLDFDEALVGLVDASLGGRLSILDPEDPGSARLWARLREQCEHAKEALTSDDVVEIPVSLGTEQFDTRIARADLETVIGPGVRSTVDAVQVALRSAQLSAAQLDGILLVGGSSRIPLVSAAIAAVMDCPIRMNVSPKNLVALGAAASTGVPLGAASAGAPPRPLPPPPPLPPSPPPPVPLPPSPPPPVPRPPSPPPSLSPPRHEKAGFEVRRFVMLMVGLAALVTAGFVAFAIVTTLHP